MQRLRRRLPISTVPGAGVEQFNNLVTPTNAGVSPWSAGGETPSRESLKAQGTTAPSVLN